jgi:hypothetical protein
MLTFAITIIAEATTQLMEDLAIGTLISHPNTLDVMMVETHSIDTSKPGPAEIEITGRSVGGILMENRVTTVKNAAPLYSPLEPQYTGPKIWRGLAHSPGSLAWSWLGSELRTGLNIQLNTC